jgi:hypothetical protein
VVHRRRFLCALVPGGRSLCNCGVITQPVGGEGWWSGHDLSRQSARRPRADTTALMTGSDSLKGALARQAAGLRRVGFASEWLTQRTGARSARMCNPPTRSPRRALPPGPLGGEIAVVPLRGQGPVRTVRPASGWSSARPRAQGVDPAMGHWQDYPRLLRGSSPLPRPHQRCRTQAGTVAVGYGLFMPANRWSGPSRARRYLRSWTRPTPCCSRNPSRRQLHCPAGHAHSRPQTPAGERRGWSRREKHELFATRWS